MSIVRMAGFTEILEKTVMDEDLNDTATLNRITEKVVDSIRNHSGVTITCLDGTWSVKATNVDSVEVDYWETWASPDRLVKSLTLTLPPNTVGTGSRVRLLLNALNSLATREPRDVDELIEIVARVVHHLARLYDVNPTSDLAISLNAKGGDFPTVSLKITFTP